MRLFALMLKCLFPRGTYEKWAGQFGAAEWRVITAARQVGGFFSSAGMQDLRDSGNAMGVSTGGNYHPAVALHGSALSFFGYVATDH